MKPLILVLGLLVWSATAAAGDPHRHGHESAGHRPFSDAEYWAGVFDDKARKGWQKPLAVLEVLAIGQGDVVADLGAGTGYFTSYFSLEVGERGKVYAVDTEQAMLDFLMTREDTKLERVIPVLAEPDDPKLPDGAIDLVVVVNTWHHIEKRNRYLRKLAASLSPEGRVAIIDYREGELPVGPPPEMKLSRDAVVEEFRKAKWTLVAESVALPYQYFLTFLPPKRH